MGNQLSDCMPYDDSVYEKTSQTIAGRGEINTDAQSSSEFNKPILTEEIPRYGSPAFLTR